MNDLARWPQLHQSIRAMIAQGQDYVQVMRAAPHATHADVVAAVRSSRLMRAGAGTRRGESRSFQALRTRFPRAYERWSDREEQTLIALVNGGSDVATIAAQLGRQPSAIRSRMFRLMPQLTYRQWLALMHP